jgi:hypothetical protein
MRFIFFAPISDSKLWAKLYYVTMPYGMIKVTDPFFTSVNTSTTSSSSTTSTSSGDQQSTVNGGSF